MNVLNGLKNGVEGFFVAKNEKPLEPHQESLMSVTLVSTVRMENSLIAHHGREAADLPNLRPLVRNRGISAEKLGAMAEAEQNAVLRKVMDVVPAPDLFNETANQLSSNQLSARGNNMVMDSVVEPMGSTDANPNQPTVQQEELEFAA